MNLNNVKLLNNQALVRVEKNFNDSILMEQGGKILIDPSYESEKHASSSGVVIALPERLTCGNTDSTNDMAWDTDIEAEVGDEIFFSWNALTIALKDGARRFIIDKQIYLLLNYKYLYVAKRKIMHHQGWTVDDIINHQVVYGSLTHTNTDYYEIVIPLNGLVLVEPIKLKDLPRSVQPEEFKIRRNIEMLSSQQNTLSENYGRVAFKGAPLKGYLELTDYYPDYVKFHCINANSNSERFTERDIKIGDVIRFKKHSDIYLQYDIHANFDGKRVFFKILRKNIVAIIEDK